MNSVNILGLNIANLNTSETLEVINKSIQEKKGITIFTPNTNFVVNSIKQPYLKDVLNSADYLVPDGMPLVWASRFFNKPLKEKVSGSSLFFLICELAAKNNYSLYFLGGNVGVADKAAIELRKKYSGLNIIGTYYAPIGFEDNQEENDKILKELNQKKPDILIIGLGKFQGERWLIKHKHEFNSFLNIQLGGSFTFAAGLKKMPPDWVKKKGFGWLWRLLEEPKRHWRRYLLEDSKFFYYIFQQKYFNKYKK